MKSRTALSFLLWLAVAGGAIEVAVLAWRKHAHPLMHVSEDLVWMAPLALLTITAMAVVAAAAVGRLRGRQAWPPLALFAGAAVVALDLLLLVPRLAPPAAAILAVGVAVQMVRGVAQRDDAVARLVSRIRAPLLAVVVLGGPALWMALGPATAAPAPSPATSSGARPPNLVFITLDTVRAANLSLYGYRRATTPNLVTLAARGMTFDAAFSTAPWTLPSHATMFTGRWPHELSVDYDAPLDGAFPTLAEVLGARGYATAGFVANLGYVGAGSGLGRGFQHFEDYPRSPGQIASSSTIVRAVADNFRVRRLIENDEHLNRVDTADLNRRALAWLDGHGDAPFMLFLNYFDAHEPYLPPPPFDRQFGPGRAHGKYSPLHHWLWNPAVGHGNMGDEERREELDAYDGALAALDAQLGALMTALDARGLIEQTVIVVTSDHGEEFGEHGVYDHGYSLYQLSLHVPLVIVAPGRVAAGGRVPAPVTLRDLAATVGDLLGVAGHGFPGASLAGAAVAGDEAVPASSPVVFEVKPSPGQPDWFPSSKGDMAGAVVGSIHYIRNGDGREELYDWRADPLEAQNLAQAAA
ncbi:MAG TPA: sulfatase, partial [Vicinamibacterales bacterium]|nr:sulfatase [Vicinamibacterales bacterium]